ncbi:MAG: tetratricopeptide repeat protein [Vulcanimicrobiota bacterium]
MLKRRCIASAIILLLTVAAHAADSPVEMLRDLFRSPVTEWKQILSQSKPLLTEQFFTNVEKRVRWGIENNHIDDAMRFAMVGDFAAEIKARPAPYRVDLAQLFFDAQNYTMAGQMVDNVLITSPETESGRKAKHIKARMAEMKQDYFNAHNLYEELARVGYEEGEMWYKAGSLSMWLEQETRAKEELNRAVKAGHVQARIELEKLVAREKGDWNQLIPPTPNSQETSAHLDQTPTNPASDKDKKLVDAAAAVDNGDLAQAKTIYQGLYREFPQDPEITRSLSALLYRMGSLEEARAFLDTALGTFPQSVDLLRFRANTEERMYDRSREVGHLEKALADYNTAIKLAPNHQFLVIEYQRAQAKHALVSGR